MNNEYVDLMCKEMTIVEYIKEQINLYGKFKMKIINDSCHECSKNNRLVLDLRHLNPIIEECIDNGLYIERYDNTCWCFFKKPYDIAIMKK